MLYDSVSEAAQYIQGLCDLKPRYALILGSGLGELALALEEAISIPYEEIPHFAQSSVVGHAGRLWLGFLSGVPVVVMQGRFHFYEGHSLEALTLPVRVMRLLGAELLLVTNAAGGINPAYRPGNLMLIRDHISFLSLAGANPLQGANYEQFGPRFPPLAHAYNAQLRATAKEVARSFEEDGLVLHEGVYTMVGGPSYETSAELKMLGILGADAVGMSTAPEVTVARHMGMKVLGLSLITNAATGEETSEISHTEVLEIAEMIKTTFIAFVQALVATINERQLV